MGEIILTMPGPWGKPPALTTPMRLELGPAEPELAADIRALALAAETMTPRQLALVDAHASVLIASALVASPGDRGPAAAAVRLARDAFAAGAVALYVETGAKVLGPDGLDGVDPDDAPTLFQLFVEILAEAHQVSTEGMQAFALPDVVVSGGAAERDWATGAAFSLAAQMVVDGRAVAAGDTFRASESAPAYTVEFAAAEPDEDDYVNPHGRWRLTRR